MDELDKPWHLLGGLPARQFAARVIAGHGGWLIPEPTGSDMNSRSFYVPIETGPRFGEWQCSGRGERAGT